MRILFDTSTLVAALIESHPAHNRAFPWLQGVRTGKHTGLIAAHSLAELYAVLTTLPYQPRISPSIARQLIEQDIVNVFEVVVLSDADYLAVVNRLSSLGLIGGAVYDALIVQAASKANVDQVLTLNERDFRRVHPDLADKIISP